MTDLALATAATARQRTAGPRPRRLVTAAFCGLDRVVPREQTPNEQVDDAPVPLGLVRGSA